jgi:hypothetical protein
MKRDLLPSEDVAGDKARKDIVAAKHTKCTYNEKLENIYEHDASLRR